MSSHERMMSEYGGQSMPNACVIDRRQRVQTQESKGPSRLPPGRPTQPLAQSSDILGRTLQEAGKHSHLLVCQMVLQPGLEAKEVLPASAGEQIVSMCLDELHNGFGEPAQGVAGSTAGTRRQHPLSEAKELCHETSVPILHGSPKLREEKWPDLFDRSHG